ncbi:MAG: hypothetical protein L0Z50_13165, partial [Verrucomicrobiales bacterium]|nr:hypothetical protein [Verrucomicrobiales bacterium]
MMQVQEPSNDRLTSRRYFLRALGIALAAQASSCAGGRPRVVTGSKTEAAAKALVMTVRGPLAAEHLGFTLPHEHVLITHTASAADLTDPEAAVRELALYAAAGGRSLVDMTNIGIKRDPVALRSISERTGVNIIMGSGFYKHKWLPP